MIENEGHYRVQVLLVGLVVVIGLPAVLACRQAPDSIPTEQFSVVGGGYRLQASAFESQGLSPTPLLLVVLHGDAPFTTADQQNTFAARAAAASEDVVAVGLLRPGYADRHGNRSDGERGLTTGDNYNAKNTDAIADAIAELRRRWRARSVVVAGHSGGAAITANILGRHPGLIEAALLVSCPCDVEKWRQHMSEQRGGGAIFKGEIETLSPIDQLPGMSNRARISMIVGSRDNITPPGLTFEYYSAAAKLGINARLVQLEGRDHEIFLDTDVFSELAQLLQ